MYLCCWNDACPDCASYDIVIDAREGEAVCRECGLVVASHLVSDEVEYRCFRDETGRLDEQQSRLGAPVSQQGPIETLPQSTITHDRTLDRLNRMCAPPAPPAAESSKPSELFFFNCNERLHLPKSVVADALGMFRATRPALQVTALTKAKQVALEAVCVFYACKAAHQLKAQKSKEHVCAAFGVQLPAFLKLNIAFTNAALNKPWYKLVTDLEEAPDMLPPILDRVGIDWTSRQRMEVSRRVGELYARHSRAMEHLEIGGVLAAMLWVVCNGHGAAVMDPQVAKKQLSKAKLAQVVGVTHTTISNNIKALLR